MLTTFQFETINPMKLCKPHWNWARCMAKTIFFLVFKAGAIVLLPDWKESKGARIEFRIAKKLKKKFIEYDTLTANYQDFEEMMKIINRNLNKH
jgi:hypothetical protein